MALKLLVADGEKSTAVVANDNMREMKAEWRSI